jgi:hypothetical protein
MTPFCLIVMMRFLFRVLCFLVPPPLPVPWFAPALPQRLVAVANALLGMVNIDLLLLFLPADHACSYGSGGTPLTVSPLARLFFLAGSSPPNDPHAHCCLSPIPSIWHQCLAYTVHRHWSNYENPLPCPQVPDTQWPSTHCVYQLRVERGDEAPTLRASLVLKQVLVMRPLPRPTFWQTVC